MKKLGNDGCGFSPGEWVVEAYARVPTPLKVKSLDSGRLHFDEGWGWAHLYKPALEADFVRAGMEFPGDYGDRGRSTAVTRGPLMS